MNARYAKKCDDKKSPQARDRDAIREAIQPLKGPIVETDSERRARLKALVKQAPECPGVYLMRDENHEVIYVGKAKVLKNRLLRILPEKRMQRRAILCRTFMR